MNQKLFRFRLSRIKFYARHPLRLLKRFLPKSFLGRSLLIVITPVAVVQIISGYVFFERHWEQTTKVLAQGVAADISLGATLLDAADTPREEQKIFHRFLEVMDLKIISSSSSQALYASRPFQSRFERALRQKVHRPYTLRVTPDKTYVWVQCTHQRFFCFSFPTKRIFSHTTPLWLFWSLGASCFFALLASFFMKRQIKPLQHLALAMEGLEEGRTGQAHRIQGATEIRKLGHMFFLMRRKLMEQIEERAAFLAGISHDLRTPLTRMRLQLALMPPSSDMHALSADLEEIIHMVEEYLAFIRSENSPTPQMISLHSFCLMCLKSFEPLSKKISLAIDPALSITLSVTHFRRCFQNLLENALRYAHSHVYVTASISQDVLSFHVDDDGMGIPLSLYQEVFKPFFRVDSGRNLQTGGTGLGLTIVQTLIHKMKGGVTLSPSSLGGLRVTLIVPV